MIRKLTLAALMTTAIALPAMAQDVPKQDRGAKGPTQTLDSQVPDMKGDASKPAATPSPSTTTSPSNTTSPATSPSPTGTTAAAPSSMGIVLSEADAKNWVGKPVYSSDNQKLGEVESFRRGADGNVIGMNAGIGGFLGLGETHVMLSSSQFKLQGDRIMTSVTAAEAKSLPKVAQ